MLKYILDFLFVFQGPVKLVIWWEEEVKWIFLSPSLLLLATFSTIMVLFSLFYEVLGNDCVNKLSPIFEFWRICQNFMKFWISFFPHNAPYTSQTFCVLKQLCTSGLYWRAHHGLAHFILPHSPLRCFPVLRNHKVLETSVFIFSEAEVVFN